MAGVTQRQCAALRIVLRLPVFTTIPNRKCTYINKTKVIRAALLDFDLNFDFDDIFKFGKISVLVTFQFW